MAKSDPLPSNHVCHSGLWLVVGACGAMTIEETFDVKRGWLSLGAVVIGLLITWMQKRSAEARKPASESQP